MDFNYDEWRSEFGKRLRKAREQKNFTQANVCNKIDIPKTQSLSSYERGTTTPPILKLKDLAMLYGVSTDWLLFGEETPSQREKTPMDYMRQLVDAVEHLHLQLNSEKDHNGKTFRISINLSSNCYDNLTNFANTWSRFKTLLQDGTIKQDEYEDFMQKGLMTLF